MTANPGDALTVDCWPDMKAAAEHALQIYIADKPDWTADLDAANGWPAWRSAFQAAFGAFDWDGAADRGLAIKASSAAANTVLGFASDL